MSLKKAHNNRKRLGTPKTRTLFELFTLTAAVILSGISASAQNTMTTAVEEAERAGFGFYSLSVFGGYTNSSAPTVDSTGTLIPNYGFHSVNAGLSASLGWRAKTSEHLHFDIRYSPAYYYQNSSTGFHSSRFTPNQNLNLGWSQTFNTRWSVGANLMVAYADYNQLLLLTDPNQIYTSIPGTAGEYASAALTGTGTNTALNSAAGAASVVAGQQNLLYGNRILTGAAGATVGYEITSRLHLSAGFSGSRMQHLNDTTQPQTGYLLQQSTSVSGTLGLNYQLSERANLSGSLSYSRAISSLYTTPSINFMFGGGYRLTQHFFVRGAGGMGYLLPGGSGPTSTPFTRTQWQASAGLGYRLQHQSFIASAYRTVSDNFGLGASANLVASAAWSWSRLGSSWGITAGAADTHLSGTSYGNRGYRVMGGVTHTIKNRAFMSLSYAYGAGNSLLLPTGGAVLNSPYSSHSQIVRLTIGMRPHLGSPNAITPSPGQGGGLQFP